MVKYHITCPHQVGPRFWHEHRLVTMWKQTGKLYHKPV